MPSRLMSSRLLSVQSSIDTKLHLTRTSVSLSSMQPNTKSSTMRTWGNSIEISSNIWAREKQSKISLRFTLCHTLTMTSDGERPTRNTSTVQMSLTRSERQSSTFLRRSSMNLKKIRAELSPTLKWSISTCGTSSWVKKSEIASKLLSKKDS